MVPTEFCMRVLGGDHRATFGLWTQAVSDAGGSRTLKHERLKFAALPVCVQRHLWFAFVPKTGLPKAARADLFNSWP